MNNEVLDGYYKTLFGHYMTEGVKALCEEKTCYWLTDAIISHQRNPKVKKEEFQSWTLRRLVPDGDKFILTCDDGNGNIVCHQRIEFSDYPDEMAKIWLIDKVLLLPQEY